MVRITAVGAAALLLAACGTMTPESGSQGTDPWSGDYRVHWLSSTKAAPKQPDQRVQIRVITPEMEVPGAQSGQDGPQWAISFVEEAGAPLPLLPFADDEYQDLKLTHPVHKDQKIKCLEAGSLLYLCKTQPHTTVWFGGGAEDQLTTTTGLFGVAEHRGGFELTPLD